MFTLLAGTVGLPIVLEFGPSAVRCSLMTSFTKITGGYNELASTAGNFQSRSLWKSLKYLAESSFAADLSVLSHHCGSKFTLHMASDGELRKQAHFLSSW